MSPISEYAATEIRVWMARRRMNQALLGEAIGHDQTWVSKRLGGRTAISLDDLAVIANALGVDPVLLLPRKDSNLQPAGHRTFGDAAPGFQPAGYPVHVLAA